MVLWREEGKMQKEGMRLRILDTQYMLSLSLSLCPSILLCCAVLHWEWKLRL
jgi:hypothetical protein